MEYLRQKLIDFQNWLKQDEDWGPGDSEHVVDSYLKSINETPGEAHTVIGNEKGSCKHDWMYKILYDHTAADVCTKCGKIELQDSL